MGLGGWYRAALNMFVEAWRLAAFAPFGGAWRDLHRIQPMVGAWCGRIQHEMLELGQVAHSLKVELATSTRHPISFILSQKVGRVGIDTTSYGILRVGRA